MTQSLIKDTLRLILLKVKPEDLFATCQTNRQFAFLCRDDVFKKAYRQQWYMDIRDKYTNELVNPTKGLIEAVKIYNKNPTVEAVALVDYFLQFQPDLQNDENLMQAVIATGNHAIIDRFLPFYQSVDFDSLVDEAVKFIETDPSIYQKVKQRFDQLFPDRSIDNIFLDRIVSYAIQTANLSLFNDYFDAYFHSDEFQQAPEDILDNLIWTATRGFAYEAEHKNITYDQPWLIPDSESRQIFNRLASHMTEIPWSSNLIASLYTNNLHLVQWIWSKLTPTQKDSLKTEAELGASFSYMIRDKVKEYRSRDLDLPNLKELFSDNPVVKWILSLGISPSNVIMGRIMGGDIFALSEDPAIVDPIIDQLFAQYFFDMLINEGNTQLGVEIINRIRPDTFTRFWLTKLTTKNISVLKALLDRAQNLGLLTNRDTRHQVIQTIAVNLFVFSSLSSKFKTLIAKYFSSDQITQDLAAILSTPYYLAIPLVKYQPKVIIPIVNWLAESKPDSNILRKLLASDEVQRDPSMLRYMTMKLLPLGNYPSS